MTLFQSPRLEPTIIIGIHETHAEDQHKHYETGMHNKETRLHRMMEGKNQKASHKANFVPHHRHSPSTSRFQRASRFASENTYPRNSHWTPIAFQHGHPKNHSFRHFPRFSNSAKCFCSVSIINFIQLIPGRPISQAVV